MAEGGVGTLGNKPGKSLFQKIDRSIQEEDEVVTCFRDGAVTLRRNRRESGFTESLKEIGYQGIRAGDLVNTFYGCFCWSYWGRRFQWERIPSLFSMHT